MIVSDLDEVLARFMDSFIKFHNAKYGTTLKEEDFKTYNFEDTIGIDRDEAIRRNYEFFGTTYAESIEPVPGSREGIDALLSSGERLAVVTSRQDEFSDITTRWLFRNFPRKFVDVRLTNRSSMNGTEERSKADVCAELGAKFVIEDQVRYALECSSRDRRIILLDKPWNQGAVPGNIARVSSWQEAVDYIRQF